MEEHLQGPRDVVIVGNPEDPKTSELRRAAYRIFAPGQSVFHLDPDRSEGFVPLAARGKLDTQDGPVAYVCQNFQCSMPVRDARALRELLT